MSPRSLYSGGGWSSSKLGGGGGTRRERIPLSVELGVSLVDMPLPPPQNLHGQKRARTSGLSSSGSSSPCPTHKMHKWELSAGAVFRCRQVVLRWFETQSLLSLEHKYLQKGLVGMDVAGCELKALLLEAVVKEGSFGGGGGFGDWVDQFVEDTLFNMREVYVSVCGDPYGASSSANLHRELWRKVEAWCGQVARFGTSKSPNFGGDKQVGSGIHMEGTGGVVLLPPSIGIVECGSARFEGSYGVVRRVRILGSDHIAESVEWAGKTLKGANKMQNRKDLSVEAMACPVEHAGIIKCMYLNWGSCESYTPWWNGGSIQSMHSYARSITPGLREAEILRHYGPDFKAREQYVVYKRNRAYLAWAFMIAVDAVHRGDVLHNDLSPSNIMLHFPAADPSAVHVGIRDWKMTSWVGEDARSFYGSNNAEEMLQKRRTCPWVAPELFHIHGPPGGDNSPTRTSLAPPLTALSESYSVGWLATRIYNEDHTSWLFANNIDTESLMLRFEESLVALTKEDPSERKTITDIVDTLKGRPWNMTVPNYFYRHNVPQ